MTLTIYLIIGIIFTITLILSESDWNEEISIIDGVEISIMIILWPIYLVIVIWCKIEINKLTK